MAAESEQVPEQLIIHVQQARAYARYLPGAESHATLVEDHVLSPEQASAAVAAELDAALVLLGAEA